MSRPPRIKGGGTGLAITALGCGLFTICAASLPYFMTRNVKPLQSREEALNSSQIRRGPYLNSGSRDAGVDPKWDFKTGTRIRDNDPNDHANDRTPKEGWLNPRF